MNFIRRLNGGNFYFQTTYYNQHKLIENIEETVDKNHSATKTKLVTKQTLQKSHPMWFINVKVTKYVNL